MEILLDGSKIVEDLIWEIEDIVEDEIENFLGSSRYEPILENIYKGLGIPKEYFEEKENGSDVL